VATSNESTLQQSIDNFLAAISLRYAAPSVSAYTQGLRLFIDHLREQHHISTAKETIDKVRLEWGNSFVGLLQTTRSVETEHLYSRALLHYFEYLHSTLSIPLDTAAFAASLEMNRRPKSHMIPAVPIEHIENIIRFAQEMTPDPPSDALSERKYLGSLRDKAFLLTLAYTGLRLSEICGLRHKQFDVKLNALNITESTHLPLPDKAASAVSAYLQARSTLDVQQRSTDLPLFARHDKRAGIRVLAISRWTGANIVDAWANQALDPAVRASLDSSHQTITPHSFRHYFVIKALNNTENDVALTQHLARHADRSTTLRYLQRISRDQPVADSPSS
jgi:integrase